MITARLRTAGLVRGRHVLAIEETTSLRDDGKLDSLSLHVMIAADDGALLELVDAAFLQHVGDKKRQSAVRAFADKESRRWLEATYTAAELSAGGATCATVIADREGGHLRGVGLPARRGRIA
ncbi:hypothetical protein H8A95_41520 [Bradyrhizobium sp. Pear76]|uniref:hypothetical protein n=1 Tax=Bradyrhizobium oropedii TaxID=1571201 RepID=UPI001E32880C|nr:hypothetical protein [Bradyrhizobium oropedii]MCC8968591.1 hypothetical protein [Bradyrhizobium oropedii]